MASEAPRPHSPPMPTPYRQRSAMSIVSEVEKPVLNSTAE
jgi:hypothetical protein